MGHTPCSSSAMVLSVFLKATWSSFGPRNMVMRIRMYGMHLIVYKCEVGCERGEG